MKNYCDWIECKSLGRCSMAFSGENCWTIYGHCTNEDFDDINYEDTNIYKRFREYEKYRSSCQKVNENE